MVWHGNRTNAKVLPYKSLGFMLSCSGNPLPLKRGERRRRTDHILSCRVAAASETQDTYSAVSASQIASPCLLKCSSIGVHSSIARGGGGVETVRTGSSQRNWRRTCSWRSACSELYRQRLSWQVNEEATYVQVYLLTGRSISLHVSSRNRQYLEQNLCS